MNKINDIVAKESIGEILLKYEQKGMTPERLKERSERYNMRYNPAQRSTDTEYAEKMKEYFAKVTSPKLLQNDIPSARKKVNYEEAKSVVWQIMVDKLGGKPSNFSREGNITEVIPELIRYFIGDSAGVYPLTKGIYLWGDTGIGKTFLIETMQTMVKELGLHARSFHIHSTPQLTDNILSAGVFEPDKYLKQESIFEDFGQEPPYLKIFSNDIKPMHSIISRAYDNYKKNGQLIHFTSMLPAKYLHETTDSSLPHMDRRTYERICEMTTPVKLTGKSKRIF